MTLSEKTLLAVVEQGGYPDFTGLYESMGYNVVMVKTPRKAISYLKKNPVALLVAEFNFQTDFRDRTSSLESIMASVQHQPDIKVVIFLDKANIERFERVSSRFAIYNTLTFPFDEEQLRAAVTVIEHSI
jgi:DNA-binding NtrC family response regulator